MLTVKIFRAILALQPPLTPLRLMIYLKSVRASGVRWPYGPYMNLSFKKVRLVQNYSGTSSDGYLCATTTDQWVKPLPKL